MPLRTPQMEASLPGNLLTNTDQHQIPVPDLTMSPYDARKRHGLFHRHDMLYGNFILDCVTSDTYILGSRIPCLIEVKWDCPGPTPFPPAQLLACKISMWKITEATALQQHHQEVIDTVILFESKSCNLPLSVGRLDLGSVFNLWLENRIEPSFRCPGLTRRYYLDVQLDLKVADKKVHSLFVIVGITVLPQFPFPAQSRGPQTEKTARCEVNWDAKLPQPPAALDQPSQKKHKQKVSRKHLTPFFLDQNHICTLRLAKGQTHGRPIRSYALSEAAITLSKLFSRRSVAHSFPGGSCIELHAPRHEVGVSAGYDSYHDDHQRIISMINTDNRFSLVESRPGHTITFTFVDTVYRTTISVEISSGLVPNLDEKPMSTHVKVMAEYHRRSSGEPDVSLHPVSLLNHCLRIAAAGEDNNPVDPQDFMHLARTFRQYLLEHRAQIDERAVAEAVSKRPDWTILNRALEQISFGAVPGGTAMSSSSSAPDYGRHGIRGHEGGRSKKDNDDRIRSQEQIQPDRGANQQMQTHSTMENPSDGTDRSGASFNLERLAIDDDVDEDDDDHGGEALPAYSEAVSNVRRW